MSDPCFCGGCDECAEALLQWELWGDEQIESDEDIMRDAVERTLDVPFELHQIEQADEACFKNMTRLGL